MPAGQILYARIWTKLSGVWFYNDASFTTKTVIVPSKANFIYPLEGAIGVDGTQPFQWTAVTNAEAYYLYVGTSPGAKDLVDTGEIQTTSQSLPALPAGQILYARIWTRLNGVWFYNDASFTTKAAIVPSKANFIYPLDGAMGVDGTQPFQWTAVANANGYYLYVGTSLGAKDLVDTGEIQTTSQSLPALPAGQILYARIWTHLGNSWYFNDVSFINYALPKFIYPKNGLTSVDVCQILQWDYVPKAQAYYLYLGTTIGTDDIYNSGELYGTRWLLDSLPQLSLGARVYARLWIKEQGTWIVSDDISFTVQRTQCGNADKVKAVQLVTAQVRAMADLSNTPYAGTELDAMIRNNNKSLASCGDYTQQLLNILGYMHIGESRALEINILNETHVLVEYFSEEQQSWILLDPTFDLAMKLKSTGLWATYEDVQNVALAQNWADIEYILFDPIAAILTNKYYIDYPLLYLNRFHTTPSNQGNSAFPFLEYTALPIQKGGIYYYLRNAQGGVSNMIIDGQNTLISFNGVDFFAQGIIPNNSINLPEGSNSTIEAYAFKRFVFVNADATFLYPMNGATGVDCLSQPFQWTAVKNVQAYYLYVGTSPGAKDVYDSGEVQVTSLYVPGMPAGQIVYARIWTKVGNMWYYYNDITFNTKAD